MIGGQRIRGRLTVGAVVQSNSVRWRTVRRKQVRPTAVLTGLVLALAGLSLVPATPATATAPPDLGTGSSRGGTVRVAPRADLRLAGPYGTSTAVSLTVENKAGP